MNRLISRAIRLFLMSIFAAAMPPFALFAEESNAGNLLGVWCVKMNDAASPNRNDRFVLRVGKDPKGHIGVYFQNLDELGGGENMFLDMADLKGGKLSAENQFLSLDLLLDPSGTFLSGTLRTKGDGKNYPIRFSRKLNFTLPRVDAGGGAVTVYSYQRPQTLSDGWKVGDLRQSPLDAKIVESGVDQILNQQFPHMESLVIVQKDQLLLDEYFKGLGPSDSHQLQSVTKSVLSILFGIAQDQGLMNQTDRLFTYFPEYQSKPGWQKDKNLITLDDLLTMTSGLPCDDWTPSKDCGQEMLKAPDMLSFVLSQPLENVPGEHFTYCTCCLEPLGAIIAAKSGMSVPDFAQKFLYDPLGIQAHDWWISPQRATEVGGSHWLRPRDMAKLGSLYLNMGKWNGQQIVSREWVEVSTSVQAPTPRAIPWDYGYLWWMEDMPVKNKKVHVYFAAGNGGQFMFVAPDLDLICVMTGDDYKDTRIVGNQSEEFFKTYVLGAFK